MERFHVLGVHENPGIHFGLLHTGHHPGKIQKELGRVVGDEDEVGIDPFGFLLSKLDIQFSRLSLFHQYSFMVKSYIKHNLKKGGSQTGSSTSYP